MIVSNTEQMRGVQHGIVLDGVLSTMSALVTFLFDKLTSLQLSVLSGRLAKFGQTCSPSTCYVGLTDELMSCDWSR